ncbi:amidase [Kitasatospora sp. NPDC004240]
MIDDDVLPPAGRWPAGPAAALRLLDAPPTPGRVRVLDDDELARLDGHAQAELVRGGELTAAELAEAAIARIERIDARLNSVTVRRFARALAEAPAAQAASGPLAGVPMLLKDLGPTCADAEATAGSAFLAGFVPGGEDAELVRRFRRAGLVILGKARTAEFGVLPTTEPRHGGPAVNPWVPGRSTGGSSGGSAAAVAAGLVPVAHANDAGGSIRIPASCCGVFGLKPTRARTPLGPGVGDLMNGLACEHVVTRSVRDSAAVLDATAGPDLGDPYPAPPAEPGAFLRAALAGPGRPLRIAVSLRPAAGGSVHPECAAAVDATARLCAELGHHIVGQDPPVGFADLAEPFLTVWAAGVSSAIGAFAALSGRTPRPEHFEDLTWHLYERGRTAPAADYLLAVGTLQRAARALARAHESYDLLLTPVTAEPAPPLGTFATGSPEQQMWRAVEFAHETPLANLTGQPSMSVPLYTGRGGLPIGVQFTGRYGADALLLALAGQLERARPWGRRLPRATTDHLPEATP